jgi:hypothetical protein
MAKKFHNRLYYFSDNKLIIVYDIKKDVIGVDYHKWLEIQKGMTFKELRDTLEDIFKTKVCCIYHKVLPKFTNG